jgi:uncharacterized SAM-binding protein YcdF (DUF218 family)
VWRAGEGLLLGALFGLAGSQLGITQGLKHPILIPAVLGAVVALTKARPAVWAAAAVVLIGFFIVGYTPLARVLVAGLEIRDDLGSAPAVVVLSSSVHKDGSLTSHAQERIVQGYLILGKGYAPRLVLTRGSPPAGSWVDSVAAQMSALGLHMPIEVVGPVRNTHDEALAVAKFAREKGWDHVILVTHPWHMRRAKAVFEKAGLHVLCSPCVEGRCDLRAMDDPGDRLGAFRYWLHEAVGYRVYKWRGWV